MIAFTDISKRFGEKQVLKSVSATFSPGKTNLIIGASGTGKSVLLKCLIGLVKPDEGSIEYSGRQFLGASGQVVHDIRRDLGMLFQGGALFDSKTVAQNVSFPLEMLTRMSKSEREDRVNYCLKRVGLEKAKNLMPFEISGGMAKRVGIARAIVMNPKYLFCDEPNSGLDPQTSITIDELIQEITHEYDITTVVVTHDMNSVLSIGEHVLFMFEGEKIWEGTRDTILDTDVEPLKQFLFSNKLIREWKNTSKA
jgi:phospholipid/cholesterol/gamma-HCH transport system ATP-binding protein